MNRKIRRRNFLLGSAGALLGSGLIVGCAAPERESRVKSFALSPEQSLPGEDLWFATLDAHDPFAANGVVVRTVDGRAKKVEGNPQFPINLGKSSARAQAGVQSVYHPDRIATPLLRTGDAGSGQFRTISWDRALAFITERMGGGASATFLTGRLDPVKQRLLDSFRLWSRADHVSLGPADQANLRFALRQVYGVDSLPHFDIGRARSIISFGSDFLGTELSPVAYSGAYAEFRGRGNGGRGLLTQIEPHMSLTGANADRWLPVQPGYEGHVALAIANELVSAGLVDAAGAERLLSASGGISALDAYAPDSVAALSGIPADTIRELAHEFVAAQPGLALAGGSALGHVYGDQIAAAVMLLNRLVGNDSLPGGVNANPVSNWEHLRAAGPATSARAASAMADSWSAGAAPDLVFVYEIDPVHDLPAAGFEQALAAAGAVVGMGAFMNETLARADLVLPGAHPFEEWGAYLPEPLRGELVLGLQQPVVTPLTQARSFGDLLIAASSELFGENSVLHDSQQSATKNMVLAALGLTAGDATAEAGWIDILRRGGVWGPDLGQTQAFAATPAWDAGRLRVPTFAGDAASFPFNLIPFQTVGIGTDPQTGAQPWLQATPDPLTTMTWKTWVEMNPEQARAMGIQRGDVLRIETIAGSADVPVYPAPTIGPGLIAMPEGQGRNFSGRWNEGRGSNVRALLPDLTSAAGGLAFASARARVSRLDRTSLMPTFELIEDPRNDAESPPVKIVNG
ncbi:MAG: molybdopterin-dependent oxidoreductase [Chloroflexota bacterium]|nr:molybdopterin-dependent oxidoreductase [Chloroflexota bacterium]